MFIIFLHTACELNAYFVSLYIYLLFDVVCHVRTYSCAYPFSQYCNYSLFAGLNSVPSLMSDAF